MDDSEKSYGYSKDIYHGTKGVGGHYEPGHADESYETIGEGDPAIEGEPLSPEEAAMHVIDREEPRPENPPEADAVRAEGRTSSTEQVESFTWENEDPSTPEK